VEFGVGFPMETVRLLDERKGYYSRNKFILKIVEEYLHDKEVAKGKKLLGAPKVGSQKHLAGEEATVDDGGPSNG
jgi:metal-responsive CopG/Arc/MetJ family transcriptional regulator